LSHGLQGSNVLGVNHHKPDVGAVDNGIEGIVQGRNTFTIDQPDKRIDLLIGIIFNAADKAILLNQAQVKRLVVIKNGYPIRRKAHIHFYSRRPQAGCIADHSDRILRYG